MKRNKRLKLIGLSEDRKNSGELYKNHGTGTSLENEVGNVGIVGILEFACCIKIAVGKHNKNCNYLCIIYRIIEAMLRKRQWRITTKFRIALNIL